MRAEGVPINDVFEIGRFLGVGPELIVSMITDARRHYRSFKVQKRSGGLRTIRAPRTYLKVVQWWILDCILVKSHSHPAAYGFVRGRSFIDNAKVHVGANYIVNIDIEDFFPSISVSMVEPVFKALGYNEKTSKELARLTSFNGELPQGAPTSPAIANAIFYQTDQIIEAASQLNGIKYTRYADDLTFSSNVKIPLSFISAIEAIIKSRGFDLNRRKTRYMGANDIKEVTGLILGKDGVRLSRKYLNGTRGWLYNLKSHPDTHWPQLAKVLGTRNLVNQVGGAGSAPIVALADETIEILRRAQNRWRKASA